MLIPASALFWGLQFAFLNPALALLLVTVFHASPGEVGWALPEPEIGMPETGRGDGVRSMAPVSRPGSMVRRPCPGPRSGTTGGPATGTGLCRPASSDAACREPVVCQPPGCFPIPLCLDRS